MTRSVVPIVSVVIPYFNAEITLERAVRSMLDQTFTDFELILVNNNSTDQSAAIAGLLASEDSRIVLLNETKQGVTYAANTGNALARGKYIARMDADDVSLPQRLQKQVDLLENHPEIGVASCLVKHVGHHGHTEGLNKFVSWVNTIQTPDEISLNCFIEAPVINPTVLFRRELLETMGAYLHGDFPEDYELWLRWISKGVNIQKVPEILFHWYDSDTRLTRTDPRYRTEAFYRTKTNYLVEWLFNNHHQNIWVWGAGRVTRQRVAMLQKEGINIEGFIDVKDRQLDDSCCIHFDQFNWDTPVFILSYVANWGAREKIRKFLISKGKIEGKDFIIVA